MKPAKLDSPLTQEKAKLKSLVLQELVRQSRHGFNMSLWGIFTSYLVTLGGIGLLYTGNVTESMFTAGMGAVSSMTTHQLAESKKEELRKLLDEISD